MKKILSLAFAVLLCTAAMAQIRVTGTVTSSEDGTPVSFATVVVKGNNSMITSTDLDGKFTLSNVPSNGVLVISFIGFTTQEVPVNNRSVLNIEIYPDASTLEEVMVVAYGTAKKSTYTGAASVVRADVIKDVPNVSFQNSLSGKVAGLQVTTSTGQAGATPSFRVRGTGSMNAGNEPLYVIDGVPVVSGGMGQLGSYGDGSNAMATLNPSDIEQITVLKDAAASSLYGSRAANGVIMIQTKRGKQGKPRVDFKVSFGFQPSFATNNYEQATPEQQIEKEYELFFNEYMYTGRGIDAARTRGLDQLNTRFNRHGYWFWTPPGSGIYNDYQMQITDYPVNRDTGQQVAGSTPSGRAGKWFDWEDAIFRTGTFQTYNLSVSGATDATSYYTSIAYTSDQGRYVMNNFNRISGRLNLTQKIGKVFEISSNVSVSKNKNTGFLDQNNVSSNIFQQVRNVYWGAYWPTDYLTGEPFTLRFGSLAYNDVYYRTQWNAAANTLRVSAVETATLHILPELNFHTTLSYDNSQTLDHYYRTPEHWGSASDGGAAEDMSTNVNKVVSSSVLDFSKTFNDKHNFSILAGFEVEQNRTDYQRVTGYNMPTSALETVITAARYDGSGYWWGSNMMSALSKAEYSFDNKYYVSASYRRDGSSRLGVNTRWGNFWSVAGSWRISNEKFMQGIDWLSNLRLRASYGINGTLPSSNYGHMALAGYTYTYMDNPGGALESAPNPDLSWETSYTYNLALEFGLLKNRITGTVEYFNRDSKNLLQSVPISRVIGVVNGTTLSNVGEMNNNGLEIEVSADIIRNRDITWNVGFTASAITSKVTKLYEKQQIIYGSRFIYREGYSPLSIYGLEWAGVKEREVNGVTFGMPVWYKNNDLPATEDDFEFNGRAATWDLGRADEIILGKADPKLFGGISTSFSYKGISIDLGFIYKWGGNSYDWDSGREVVDDGYYWERTSSVDQYKNRWTPENRNSKYPSIIGIDMEDVRQHSSRHMHDASFIRLKNLTIAYSLPKTLLEKVKIDNARVYFNGGNMWTWAAYKEFDPEVRANGVRSWEMPIGKSFTFGLEIGF